MQGVCISSYSTNFPSGFPSAELYLVFKNTKFNNFIYKFIFRFGLINEINTYLWQDKCIEV